MAHVINGILYGTLKTVFYKKSLHAGEQSRESLTLNVDVLIAITPEEIHKFLISIDQHARSLLLQYNKYVQTIREPVHRYQKPIITVSKAIQLLLM